MKLLLSLIALNGKDTDSVPVHGKALGKELSVNVVCVIRNTHHLFSLVFKSLSHLFLLVGKILDTLQVSSNLTFNKGKLEI